MPEEETYKRRSAICNHAVRIGSGKTNPDLNLDLSPVLCTMTVTWLPEVVNPIEGLKNAPQLDTVLLLRGVLNLFMRCSVKLSS
jgi:hypothetical protein